MTSNSKTNKKDEEEKNKKKRNQDENENGSAHDNHLLLSNCFLHQECWLRPFQGHKVQRAKHKLSHSNTFFCHFLVLKSVTPIPHPASLSDGPVQETRASYYNRASLGNLPAPELGQR